MSSVGNIKHSELINILKTNWLNFGISRNEQLQNTPITIDLFTTYSKLWSIPKLISKLLVAFDELALEKNEYIQQGCIDISVLKEFAHSMQVIPFNQVIELWDMFITSLEKHVETVQLQHLNYGSTFIISQFFSTFLLHAQIFEEGVLPVIQEKILLLLIKTSKLIENMCKILTSGCSNDLLKLSSLLIVHSYSEIKLTFNVYAPRKILSPEENCCELSAFPVHISSGQCNLRKICEDFLNKDNKRISYIAYKLLIHEIKTKLYERELDDETIQNLKSIVSLLIEATVASTPENCFTEWDFNISSIDSTNYGVAFWNLFLGHLHLFIRFISDKNLVRLCSSMIEILTSDLEDRPCASDCISLRSFILKFISSNSFAESRQFQTAFVTAVWRHATSLISVRKRKLESDSHKFEVVSIFEELQNSERKWEKYSVTTPKEAKNNEMNKMWTRLHIVSDTLNNLLEKSSSLTGKLKHADVKKLLKVLDFLPLEHLMPGNQVRCMLGLSTLLFLHSDSSLLSDNLESVQTILKLLIAIFEGVRSIWIFDFVHAVPYVRAVIYLMEQLPASDFTSNREICKKLLENVFQFTTRNTQSLSVFEHYLPELILHTGESEVFTMAFLCLLQRLIELLQRSYLPSAMKNISEKLANIACSSISKAVRHWKKKDESNFKIDSSLVSCFEGLIKLIVNPNCKLKENNHDKWLKHLNTVLQLVFDNIDDGLSEDEVMSYFSFICTVSTHRSALSSHICYDFTPCAWKFLRTFMSRKVQFIKKNMVDKDKTEITCYFCCNNNFLINEASSLNDNLDFEGHIRKHIFTESVKETLIGIVKSSTETEFNPILQELFDEIENIPSDIGVLDSVEFVMSLVTVADIFNSTNNENQLTLLSKLAQNCLTKLGFIVNQACDNKDCLLKLVVPSLHFISSVLKKGKNKLPRQSIIQCLYICSAINAEKIIKDPVTFSEVYNSLWGVLSELLIHHSSYTIACIPALIQCITHLLKLVISASNQDVMLTYEDQHQKKILICAQNFDKMTGLLIKYKTELAKIVPYIVADYLDLVQNITVYPPAKVTLISAVNKLLDICSKESLKMLAININYSCREIFNMLLKNYNQTRFTGQI